MMQEMEEEDRISQLQDAILHLILSSIDIKETVETSILSKRWINLWRSMPQLHFNFYRLSRRTQLNLHNRRDWLHFTNHFTHFVTQFLSHRDPAAAVTKFHLSLRGVTNPVKDPAFVVRCVDYAVSHGVRDLDVHELCCRPTRFPDAFFACETLRELGLRRFGQGFYIPKQFSLPNLTTLYVERSSFHYDEDLFYGAKEPFAGFPNLEKLSLNCCSIQGLIIVSPKLKILEITFDQESFYGHPCMKRISTPKLTTFRYQGSLPVECSELGIPILEQVYLECSGKMGQSNRFHRQLNMPLKCLMLLQQFGNAKVVTLALDTLEVLEMDPGLLERSPSPFSCIKCLKLTRGRSVRHPMSTVLRGVMNYLTACDESVVVESPQGVCVVENKIRGNVFDEDGDDRQLQWLCFETV